MMIYKRLSIVLFLLLGSINLPAQQYQNLVLEKSKNPDIDNKIFTPAKGFVYQVLIYELGEQKQLNISGSDWALDENSAEQSINEVIYVTATVKNSKRTNRRQTEVIIAYEPFLGVFQNTGIVENAQNVWLHPPRSYFFKILELCPFPYVKLASDSLAWKDQIKIGQFWQDERWASWEGDLLIDLTYKNKGSKNTNTNLGNLLCLVTESKAKASVGEAALTTYYNAEFGFVKMEYEIFEKYKLQFQLVDVVEYVEIKSPQDYLMHRRK